MNLKTCAGICCIVFLLSSLIMCDKERKSNGNGESSNVTESSRVKDSASNNYSYTVSAFRGNVSWSKDDSLWAPVSDKLTINPGAWAETGEMSLLTLQGSLGDAVMMGERAKVHLLIGELKAYRGSTSLAMRGLQLLKGTVRFAIHKDPSGFVVKTPSATIRVKGTQFIVSCDEKSGRTDVKVLEGVVEVVNDAAGKPVQLLYKGEVLNGIDKSGEEQKRQIREEDTLSFHQFTNDIMDSSQRKNSAAIKQRLENEQKESSSQNSLSSVKTDAVKTLDSAKAVAEKSIDSVRKNYEQAADKEYRKHEDYKVVQENKIDSTKTAAQNALDRERSSFDSKTKVQRDSINKKSDDAFDELNRRKSGW